MSNITVIIKRPGEAPESKNIENTLETLQSIVGGYIQTVTIAEDLVIICNEEGRLKNLPYNCDICGISFAGPIIICGFKGEDFSDIPCDTETFKRIFGDLK